MLFELIRITVKGGIINDVETYPKLYHKNCDENNCVFRVTDDFDPETDDIRVFHRLMEETGIRWIEIWSHPNDEKDFEEHIKFINRMHE